LERGQDRGGPPLSQTAAVAPRESGTVGDGRPAVAIDHVTAGYGPRIALSDVSLTVQPGSLLAVIGPNGAGKSTLLKLIANLLRPDSGTISVLGSAPGVEARSIAYLPQAEAVDWEFPVTVGEVAMMGRYARLGFGRRPSAIDRERVFAALETVGMAGATDRQIGALSGGQRRRVFLARAIAAEPKLYLLDEPVTGVDATTQEELMDVLEAEARSGKTVIASTHDLICAAQRFHQAAFINGRVIATGPAEIVLDQALLSETYGGHVLILPGDGGRLVLDDAHHHDEAARGERHFHDESRG
jgi:manganese/iron transport system ATP-binding protein/manganese/zinc/iron transport system ATP- binding protein